MKEIPLTQGKAALVDDDDYERVSALKWFAAPSGKGGLWYAARSSTVRELRAGAGRKVFLHRFIMQPPHDKRIDHKNGDGLDCRRGNMRIATAAQNCRNRKMSARNRSGFKGVQYEARYKKPWVASVWIAEKRANHYEYYTTPEDAARAYDRKAKEMFGEFARLNFPENTDLI